MSFFSDFFNLAFKAGIPYDAERNRFEIGPAEAARIDFQRQQDEEMNSWMNRSMNSSKSGAEFGSFSRFDDLF